MLLAAFLVLLEAAGCGPRSSQPLKTGDPAVAWRRLGSWSGRGDVQTESFTSDTGVLRVRWETTVASADAASSVSNGTFRVTAHSAISGRPLQQIVDHIGSGSAISYAQQDPHVFYIVVESAHLDWTFTVEEATAY